MYAPLLIKLSTGVVSPHAALQLCDQVLLVTPVVALGCNRARAKDSAGFLAFSLLEPR